MILVIVCICICYVWSKINVPYMGLVRLSLAFVYVYSIVYDGGNGRQVCGTWEVMYHIIAL